jgi:hypothetical protein
MIPIHWVLWMYCTPRPQPRIHALLQEPKFTLTSGVQAPAQGVEHEDHNIPRNQTKEVFLKSKIMLYLLPSFSSPILSSPLCLILCRKHRKISGGWTQVG